MENRRMSVRKKKILSLSLGWKPCLIESKEYRGRQKLQGDPWLRPYFSILPPSTTPSFPSQNYHGSQLQLFPAFSRRQVCSNQCRKSSLAIEFVTIAVQNRLEHRFAPPPPIFFCISIALAKICFSRIFSHKLNKNTSVFGSTVLKTRISVPGSQHET